MTEVQESLIGGEIGIAGVTRLNGIVTNARRRELEPELELA